MPTFSPDYDAVRIALVSCVRACTGLDQNHVVMLEPETANAPRPRLPYVAVKVRSASARFGDDTYDGATSGGPRGMEVLFASYAATHETAYELLARLQAGLDTDPIQQGLSRAGIAVWQQEDVTDESRLLSAGYEGRAEMVVSMGLAANLSIVLQTIEKVTAVGNVPDADTISVTISGD